MSPWVDFWLSSVVKGSTFGAVYFLLSRYSSAWKSGEEEAVAAPQPAPATPAPAPANSLEPDSVRELLKRLGSVATTVGQEVDAHNAAIGDIGSELTQAASSGQAVGVDVVLRAVERIAAANERLHTQLDAAQSTIQQQSELLEAQVAEAQTDALTGIANRRAFDRQMASCLQGWTQSSSSFSLVMLDVDFFKKFNDQYGHQAGDEVLKAVGRTLSLTLPDAALVARFGGEEFAVLVAGPAEPNGRQAVEQARAAINAQSLSFQGQELRVTASLGLAEVVGGDDAENLLRRADEALYASKKAGRNCGHWHTPIGCQPLTDLPGAVARTAAPVAGKPAASASAAANDPMVDEVTGLPTRMAFHADLRRRLAEWRRHPSPLSILLLEVDDFKRLSQGQPDLESLILVALGKFLGGSLREMDLVARYGANCFAVLAPSTSLGDAAGLAERLRQAVAECDRVQHQGAAVKLTVSVGLAEPCDGDDAGVLMQRVEDAVRSARTAGRNCTRVHNGRTIDPVEPALTA